jgi:hypothetical protein
VRRHFHEMSNPCPALGRKHEEAGVKGSMAATAHSKCVGEIVGDQIARQILTVVVALHAILVEPFLGASRTDVGSVQTVSLSSEDACPVAGDNCSGHVRHRWCAHKLLLWLWVRCSRPRLHPRREGVGVVWVAPVVKADAYRVRVELRLRLRLRLGVVDGVRRGDVEVVDGWRENWVVLQV